MILDEFRAEPDFPFDKYFESANQYTFALQYWFRVLRSAPNFVETEWKPRKRLVEQKEDMYLGKVIDILSIRLKKEINLQTRSILGDANELFKENKPISNKAYAKDKELFGKSFELDEKTFQGITYKEALRKATNESRNNFVESWVEKGIHWQSDPSHPKGGYEMDIERLILTSEISERAEPKAIQALELFLQDGPAMERVNSVFVSDEE